HAHPGGTKEGAMALVQACDAYLNKMDITEYARDHRELVQAIDYFTKAQKDAM
ncbi:MAG: ribulose 1,5-bisphosphate carboxylase, partial [Methanomethylovorans sp.]|nr:ribulose 1,5-bisphosphate carboxylase [Methanomethylovorans sp.]